MALYEHACQQEGAWHTHLAAEFDPLKRMEIIRSFRSDPRVRWAGIALRDGTMTAYHFSCILKAITFGECPTLKKRVEHSKLRMARHKFDILFPQAVEARHSVGHSAEMVGTTEDIRRNTLRSGYNSENIKVSEGVHLSLRGVRDGHRLVSTWADPHTRKSRAVFSDCSRQTLDGLYRVKNLVCEAFQPAERESRRLLREQLRRDYELLRQARERVVCAIRARFDLV